MNITNLKEYFDYSHSEIQDSINYILHNVTVLQDINEYKKDEKYNSLKFNVYEL